MISSPALESLLSRVSVSALIEPAPTGDALDRILAAGLRAADHGRLAPWRYILIRGLARASFADVIETALRARDPEATQAMVDKQRGKFLRAPLTIALGARIRSEHKVSPFEQMQAVAAGAMNLLNAIHASGFGAIWVSGANSTDPVVAASLGMHAPDRLAGFMFVGTPAAPPPSAPPRELAEHVREWSGADTAARWAAAAR